MERCPSDDGVPVRRGEHRKSATTAGGTRASHPSRRGRVQSPPAYRGDAREYARLRSSGGARADRPALRRDGLSAQLPPSPAPRPRCALRSPVDPGADGLIRADGQRSCACMDVRGCWTAYVLRNTVAQCALLWESTDARRRHLAGDVPREPGGALPPGSGGPLHRQDDSAFVREAALVLAQVVDDVGPRRCSKATGSGARRASSRSRSVDERWSGSGSSEATYCTVKSRSAGRLYHERPTTPPRRTGRGQD